jgi:hypothetical protein
MKRMTYVHLRGEVERSKSSLPRNGLGQRRVKGS